MKHNLKITLILLAMFFISQLIGLAVINEYSPKQKVFFNETSQQYENITIKTELPYGMQPPEIKPGISIGSIITSMIIAIFLIFILMKMRARIILKMWFFFVVVIALSITINSVFLKFNIPSYTPLIFAFPLAFYKIFKRNIIVHNLTELLIYPGIAAVFVPMLNILTVSILLILISAYDIYAVWHSGFMQKMAKFQINKLKIFAGFFVPYLGKKEKKQFELIREKYKNKIPSRILKNKKIKINLAILGGGDVVFPMILAGVVLKTLGFFPALLISVFATLALLYLFIKAEKGKFYPAMPFISAGCFIGLILSYLIHVL